MPIDCPVNGCGPTVDQWFSAQLTTIKGIVSKYQLSSAIHKNFWKSLKFEKAGLTADTNCPTYDCRSTVPLCGKCIDVTELGNLAFGFAGGMGSDPYFGQWAYNNQYISLWGGFYVQTLKNGRGFNSLGEIASALIGYSLNSQWDSTPGGLCTILGRPLTLKKNPIDWLKDLTDGIENTNNLFWLATGGTDALAAWNKQLSGKLGTWKSALKNAMKQLLTHSVLDANLVDDCEPCVEPPFLPFSVTVAADGTVIWK